MPRGNVVIIRMMFRFLVSICCGCGVGPVGSTNPIFTKSINQSES
nr:MAG TPA: hypothetical protein [Caudoviricetes sp.]